MTEPQQNKSAWIFVSHSLKDWDRVRIVRNLLEDRGHKPLLFFLRCLNDSSEIDGLIRREIDARKWFVLCDSDNARNSRWVKEEVEIIKSLPGKIYETVDLQADLEEQIRRIDALSRRITVFLSYHHRDGGSFASKLKKVLEEHEYSVFDVESISTGSKLQQELEKAIDEATRRGFFLILLSEESINSPWVKYEFEYAMQYYGMKGCNIIPIMISPLTTELMDWKTKIPISSIQWLDFTIGNFDDNTNKLLKIMENAEIE